MLGDHCWLSVLLSASLALPCMAQAPLTRVGSGMMVLEPIYPFTDGEVAHVIFGDHATPSGLLPLGLKYARSTDRGQTWTSITLTPPGVAKFAAAGGLFAACSNSQGVLEMRRSLDGGSTWLPPVTVGPTADPLAIAWAGGTCHVLGRQRASGIVQYLRSADVGATWSLPVTLGTGSYLAVLRVAGADLHAAWVDSAGLRYQHSADLGLTWSPPAYLGAGPINQLSLEVVGRLAHLVTAGPGGFQYRRSADAGATWSGALVAGNSIFSVLRVDGPRVWLAYADTNNTQLVVSRSPDHGATWNANALGTHGLDMLAIASDGTVAAVLFQVRAAGVRSVATTSDGGANWQLRTDAARTFTGPLFVRGPTISFAEWAGLEIVQCVSRDAGGSWDANRPLVAWHPVVPEVVAYLPFPGSCSALLVSGQYQGSPSLDTRLLFGHQPYGTGAPGSGAIAPALRVDGEPLLGRLLAITVTGCVGGAPALVCASATGRANIPFGGGRLLLDAPHPMSWATAGGTPGLPGVGSVTFGVAVPMAVSLRGLALDWQGFALDSSAPGTFTSTQGVESWLL